MTNLYDFRNNHIGIAIDASSPYYEYFKSRLRKMMRSSVKNAIELEKYNILENSLFIHNLHFQNTFIKKYFHFLWSLASVICFMSFFTLSTSMYCSDMLHECHDELFHHSCCRKVTFFALNYPKLTRLRPKCPKRTTKLQLTCNFFGQITTKLQLLCKLRLKRNVSVSLEAN